MKDTIVIYHANCYDGVTAAWVCWEKFGDNAEYIPMNYSDAVDLEKIHGKNLVIADFSFKRAKMKEIILLTKSTVVLDHHATAKDELDGILEELQSIGQRQSGDTIIFDMNRSGAGIAWDYFFPHNTRSWLVNYVEDRDLWRFLLPDSKIINAVIQSYSIDLDVWKNEVSALLSWYDAWDKLIDQGKAILRMQQSLTKAIVANARVIQFTYTEPEGYVTALECPYVQTYVLMSEVCDKMLSDYPNHPFVMYSFYRADGKYQYGLRSRPDFDCSFIAKKFGGGGHKQAAGFELDYQL